MGWDCDFPRPSEGPDGAGNRRLAAVRAVWFFVLRIWDKSGKNAWTRRPHLAGPRVFTAGATRGKLRLG